MELTLKLWRLFHSCKAHCFKTVSEQMKNTSCLMTFKVSNVTAASESVSFSLTVLKVLQLNNMFKWSSHWWNRGEWLRNMVMYARKTTTGTFPKPSHKVIKVTFWISICNHCHMARYKNIDDEVKTHPQSTVHTGPHHIHISCKQKYHM